MKRTSLTASPSPTALPLHGVVSPQLFRFPRLHAESDTDAPSDSPHATTLTFHNSMTPTSRLVDDSTPRPQTSGSTPAQLFGLTRAVIASSTETSQKRLSGTDKDSAQTSCSPPANFAIPAAPAGPSLCQAAHDSSAFVVLEGKSRDRQPPARHLSSSTKGLTNLALGSDTMSSAHPPIAGLDTEQLACCGPQHSMESPEFANTRHKSKLSASRTTTTTTTDTEDRAEKRSIAAGHSSRTLTEERGGSPKSAEYTIVLASVTAADVAVADRASGGPHGTPHRGSLRNELPPRQRTCGTGPPSLAFARLVQGQLGSSALPDVMHSAIRGEETDVVQQVTSPCTPSQQASNGAHTQSTEQGVSSPTLFLSPPPPASQPDTVTVSAAHAMPVANGKTESSTTPAAVPSAWTGLSGAVTADSADSGRARRGSVRRGSLATGGGDYLSFTQQSAEGLSALVADSLVTMAAFPAQPLTTTVFGGTATATRAGHDGQSPIMSSRASPSDSSTGISAFAKDYLAQLTGFTGWQGFGIGSPHSSPRLPRATPRGSPCTQQSPSLPPPDGQNNTVAASHNAASRSSSPASRASELWSARSAVSPVSKRTGSPYAQLPSRSGSPRAVCTSPLHVNLPSSVQLEQGPAAARPTSRGAARTPRRTLLPSEARGSLTPSATSPSAEAIAPLTLASFERTSPARDTPSRTPSSSLSSRVLRQRTRDEHIRGQEDETNQGEPVTTPAAAVTVAHGDAVKHAFPKKENSCGAPPSHPAAQNSTLRFSPIEPGHLSSFPSLWNTKTSSTLLTGVTPAAGTEQTVKAPAERAAQRPVTSPNWSLHSRSLRLSRHAGSARRRHSSSAESDGTFFSPAATGHDGQSPRDGGAAAHRDSVMPMDTPPAEPPTTDSFSALRHLPCRRSQSQMLLGSLSGFPSSLSTPSDHPSSSDSRLPHWRRRRSSSMLVVRRLGSPLHYSPLPPDAARRDTAMPAAAYKLREAPCSPEVKMTRRDKDGGSARSLTGLTAPPAMGATDTRDNARCPHDTASLSTTLGTSAEVPSVSAFAFPTPSPAPEGFTASTTSSAARQ